VIRGRRKIPAFFAMPDSFFLWKEMNNIGDGSKRLLGDQKNSSDAKAITGPPCMKANADKPKRLKL
jgi:hypothetical protein